MKEVLRFKIVAMDILMAMIECIKNILPTSTNVPIVPIKVQLGIRHLEQE